MTEDARYRPTGLANAEEGKIRIDWADGESSILAAELLRAECPCANCVDEWTGKRLFTVERAKGVTIKSMSQVGHYAFAITFSDAHDTGIFTYRRLRELAEA